MTQRQQWLWLFCLPLLMLLANLPEALSQSQGGIFDDLPTQTPSARATRQLPAWLLDATVTPRAISSTPFISPTPSATLNVPQQLSWMFGPDSPFTPRPPTATATPSRVTHQWLYRPIELSAERVHWVDRTYPYGSTQLGNRSVHLGVEFANPRFTPVLAAEEGRVLYAGNDSSTQFGPRLNYYGNLIVLEHTSLSAPDGRTLYTLYGHLQRMNVQTGQRVNAGDQLGAVGDSGIALGPHLHFEVRVAAPYDYRSTRNPELWLRPYVDHGTLAGFATVAGVPPAEYGERVVLLVRKRNNGDGTTRETYAYEGTQVNSSSAWGENFVLGDLPSGDYEVIVSTRLGRVRFQQHVSIESGHTTWLEVPLAACPDDACF